MLEKIGAFFTSIVVGVTGFFSSPDVVHVPAPAETPTIAQQVEEETLGGFAPAAGGTYRLKSSVGTTDTTIQLSSFKEPVSNVPITMSTLASDIGYATIDPQSSTRKEFISFTSITQNSDGSASLGGVTRGLGFQYPYTASSTLRKEHPGQSILILSDSPQLFNEYARRRSDESITGSWTVPTPTSAGGIANKSYVDSVVSGGTVTTDSLVIAATAGETVATGTIVYFDGTQAKWYKADADNTASSTRVQLGVAQGGGTNGNSISGGVLVRGYDETQTNGTSGQTIYLSNTAGATSTTAGTVSVVLGQMRSASVFYFNPDYANNVAAAGNNTLSGTNSFTGTTTFGALSSVVALATSSTSNVNITSSATTTILSTTIPAHSLGSGNGIRYKAYVDMSVDAGGRYATFDMAYGNASTSMQQLVYSLAFQGLGVLEFTIYGAGTTSSQDVVMYGSLAGRPGFGNTASSSVAMASSTLSVNSTTNQPLMITARTDSANAKITILSSVLEYIR